VPDTESSASVSIWSWESAPPNPTVAFSPPPDTSAMMRSDATPCRARNGALRTTTVDPVHRPTPTLGAAQQLHSAGVENLEIAFTGHWREEWRPERRGKVN
jgi:hypothetical protein